MCTECIAQKVYITKVTIGSFRNLINQEFDLAQIKSNKIAFSGTNHLGKTNVLNAIMWCLCGVDLEDSSDYRKNIPLVLGDTEENCIDVTVELNVGTIRRYATLKSNKLEQKLCINDTECESLKNGEIQIDSMLGILPLVIKAENKGFKVRRFLLNPLYINSVSNKDFRTFVLSLLDEKVSYEEEFSKLNIHQVNMLGEYEKSHDPFAIYKTITDAIKSHKKRIDGLDFTKKYLEPVKDNYHELYANVVEEISSVKKKKTECEISLSVAEEYLLSVNKRYHDIVKNIFKGIDFCLLEKGVGDDVWVETCYPLIKKDIPFSKGSTSEKIVIAAKLVTSVMEFAREFGILPRMSLLPLLFDEAETIDHRTSYELSMNIDTQMVSAKVCEGLEGIAIKHF